CRRKTRNNRRGVEKAAAVCSSGGSGDRNRSSGKAGGHNRANRRVVRHDERGSRTVECHGRSICKVHSGNLDACAWRRIGRRKRRNVGGQIEQTSRGESSVSRR